MKIQRNSTKLGLGVLMTLVLLLASGLFIRQATASVIPTISIVAVEKDSTVTVTTHNYPANDTFEVRMGKMYTRGVNGILVGTIDSGAGGSFDATFTIPDELKGDYKIAIRLESPTSGYYSFNWFYNNTATATPIPVPTPSTPVTTTVTIPTIHILSVMQDNTVTLETKNYPANDTFEVRMGKMYTRGIGGILVDTIDSGSGGTFTATFTIPDALKGDHRIAIRLQSPTSGYYSYNWFYNNTTD